MILPEHKERIRNRRDEARRGGKRERPELDEQEWERINEAIARSLHEHVSVRLRIYDPFGERAVSGVVERVDRVLGRIRIMGNWHDMREIVGVEDD
jgi:hypothetical protein